ncbi:hypothetical protein MD588_12235 [Photobacterium sp. SDRW27]|uniref:hypothetical protein n=1 Tax=Photobacterium obscurum TaxID=2829490 RepID=UPI0022444C85|nr:hypothetical protein [Photobacterium obscurum]MCW8329575.1 hypothetical protein [Photobacterium obscurum]
MGIKLSRRGWNNVIIIAVVLFIAMIQFPDLIRERFGTDDRSSSPVLQSLLPEQAIVSRLVLPQHVITSLDGQWVAEPRMEEAPQTIVEHWQSISGTTVDEDMMAQLKPQLSTPVTVEVWLQAAEEPVRVTVYQLPQFWLLSSWQGAWLAITVEESYLFPN